MAIGDEIARARQRLERPLLPHCFWTLDEIENAGIADEKATIDQAAIARRFLAKPRHPVAVEFERAEPAWRRNRCDRRATAVRLMERHLGGDIDVCDAIPVGKAERLTRRQVIADCTETTTGHGIRTCIDQCHPPRLAARTMPLQTIVDEIDGYVGCVQEVVRKELFDHVALVAQADDKVSDTAGIVDFHNVPQDWHAANFDHRFGTYARFLAQSATQPSREDYCCRHALFPELRVASINRQSPRLLPITLAMTALGEKRAQLWRGAVLTTVLALALAFRLRGLDFGLPALLDADEPIFVLLALKLLKEHTLNPGWFGHPGTTTIYSLAIVAILVIVTGLATGRFADPSDFARAIYADPTVMFLPGRVMIMLCGLLTIVLAYRLARRLFGTPVALLTAALLAIDPVHIRYSQIIRTDMQATIFVLLVLTAAVQIAEHGRLRSFLVAGMWLGLACATKWPSATAAAGVAGATVYRAIEFPHGRPALWRGLVLSGVTAVVALIVVSPYLVLDFGTLVSNLRGEGRPIHLGATGGSLAWNLGWYLVHPLRDALGLAGLAVGAFGLVVGSRRSASFGWVIVPSAAMFALSISAQHLVWERWVVPLLPLLTMALAVGAVALVELAKRFGNRFAVPAAIVVTAVIVFPPLHVADAQAAERANDTRRIATAWARVNIPANSRVAVEYLALDILPADWRFLFPMGTKGCLDGRGLLTGQVTVARVGASRAAKPIVDFGGIDAAHADSCRGDYLILINYDRYLAEQGRYPEQVRNYQRIMLGGKIVATFHPHPGSIGGPVVRIVRLGEISR